MSKPQLITLMLRLFFIGVSLVLIAQEQYLYAVAPAIMAASIEWKPQSETDNSCGNRC